MKRYEINKVFRSSLKRNLINRYLYFKNGNLYTGFKGPIHFGFSNSINNVNEAFINSGNIKVVSSTLSFPNSTHEIFSNNFNFCRYSRRLAF